MDIEKIKYFCLDVEPRYWEDSDINGESDIDWEKQKRGVAPRMPLSYRNKNKEDRKDSLYSWKLKINIETGEIIGWPEDVSADIHYKVCDAGTYWLETESGEVVHKVNSYVPDVIDFYESSYGDYIIFIIENASITEWKADKKTFITKFLETKGF